MKWFRAVMVLGLLACLAPFGVTALAAQIASAYSCTLHEGFVNPCLINGADWGETLYTMGMMGWLMLFTIPIGAALFALWIAVESVQIVRKSRAKSG